MERSPANFASLMEGGQGAPIPVYLIEHPKGRALFDTGLHPDCHGDPAGRVVARIAGLFKIGFRSSEDVNARLEAIDRDPGKSISSSEFRPSCWSSQPFEGKP